MRRACHLAVVCLVRDGRRALALTEALMRSNRSWTLLETRAMAAAELRDFDAAITSQQAAIDEAGKSHQRDAVAYMQMILDLYRRGMPCRTPWRANDAVHAPRPSA